MNNRKNNSALVDQEKIDFSGYEDVYYMYETPETGLFESTVMIEGLEFASIESLKKVVNEQYVIVSFEEDDEEEIAIGEKLKDLIGRVQWDDLLICKEGAYMWNDQKLEYEYVGKFNKQNTYRVKRVEIPEDKAILIGDEITVIRAGHYDIEREEVKVINSDVKIEMLTIKLVNGKQVAIPNSPGLFKIYEVDYALIDYIDESKN